MQRQTQQSLRNKLVVRKVQEIQADNNWNDAELARAIGISRQSWSDIKNLGKPIGKIVYKRILDSLSLTEDEIFRPEAKNALVISPFL